WVTVDALGEHWRKARVDAAVKPDGSVAVTTENVNALSLDMPPGFAPFPPRSPVRVVIDGATVEAPRPRSDRSWSTPLPSSAKAWGPRALTGPGLRKAHDLQGPIDDAFMDSFVFVRPTGKSPRPRFRAWAEHEMARAVDHWRRHFRGEARVKDDTQVN